MNGARIEDATGLDGFGRERIHEQRTQRAAEPIVSGNVEAHIGYHLWGLLTLFLSRLDPVEGLRQAPPGVLAVR